MGAVPQEHVQSKPSILFVDDEPKVLKSMRALFRKDYDVNLANSGQEALDIIHAKSIQVVVSDQRMPNMTGVEVLTTIKDLSPTTVRILLTGYADLDAIEAALNEAEVFRYLMKPCAADDVRGAVKAGLDLQEREREPEPHIAEVITLTVPQPATSDDAEDIDVELSVTDETEPSQSELTQEEASSALFDEDEIVEVIEADLPEPEAEPDIAAEALKDLEAELEPTLEKDMLDADVAAAVEDSEAMMPAIPAVSADECDIVLLGNVELTEALQNAAPNSNVHCSFSLTEAIAVCAQYPVGILVADIALDRVDEVMKEIRTRLPHLVTLVASDRSDGAVLIKLINSGLVFRFLVKPVQPGRLSITMNSALARATAPLPAVSLSLDTRPSRWTRFVNWLLGRSE